MSATHPDEATLLRSIAGDLPDHSQTALKKHLVRCRTCRIERDRTKRLHRRLAGAGDSLAFAAGDPFQERPVPRGAETQRGPALTAMADALARLQNEKNRLRAAIDVDPSKAANELAVADAAVRLAAAHILEEAVESDPLKGLATFASVLAKRGASGEGETEAVLPAAQLEALSRLVTGSWHLFCGRAVEATGEFAAAWEALARFDAPEHLVAWAEVGDSLRRSYRGRPTEGHLLADRALETFNLYGLSRGVLRARHARAVALYTASRFAAAHREFRAVIRSNEAPVLDRARAASGASFCLAARGRFYDVAKEYQRVRHRLRGDQARTEQCFLQGEMKAALGTAGRWRVRADGLAAFELPEAAGAFHARSAASEIVKAAGEHRIAVAKDCVAALDGESLTGYALIQAVQLAVPKVSTDPVTYVELGRVIAGRARGLSCLKVKRPAQPVSRLQIVGEAQFLESNALNFLGKGAEALLVAKQARATFSAAGRDTFALAQADYLEGSAASFEGAWGEAGRLLRRALGEFKVYGLQGWAGRAEGALGTLLGNRNRCRSALMFFDRGLRDLDPALDAFAYACVLSNRAFSLLLLGRLGEARAGYAKALGFARQMQLNTMLMQIRYGLAQIELREERPLKALHSFTRLAEDARAMGFDLYVLSARLRAAECLGRVGRHDEMLERIRSLRRERNGLSVESDPPIRELFVWADQADLSTDLVAHVVDFIEARDRGVQRAYRPFKVVKGGG